MLYCLQQIQNVTVIVAAQPLRIQNEDLFLYSMRLCGIYDGESEGKNRLKEGCFKGVKQHGSKERDKDKEGKL